MSLRAKSTFDSVFNFLSDNRLKLEHSESVKLLNFIDEKEVRGNSLLGWIYFRFKKILQGDRTYEGKHVDLTLGDSIVYSSFANDFNQLSNLSDYYGNKYRGSFVLIYFFGALAVLSALIPIGFSFEEYFGHKAHDYAEIFTVIELFLILSILLIHKLGGNPHHHEGHKKSVWLNQRWHERWLDYRILTERFRHMEVLYPLGIDPLKEGALLTKEMQSWTDAYFATRVSQTPTQPIVDLTPYKTRLLDIIKIQHNYHHKNAHRCDQIHHRLHTAATWLFYATLLACLTHFFWHNGFLTLLAGFFPALAAALHGILASGEYSKSAEISDEMHKQLSTLIARLKSTDSETDIRQIAIDFHNMAIGEVDSWRSIFKDKNVPLA